MTLTFLTEIRTYSPVYDHNDTVHPHTRGEPTRAMLLSVTGSGSSPHAWGTLLSVDGVSSFDRFIPTRVGNP